MTWSSRMSFAHWANRRPTIPPPTPAPCADHLFRRVLCRTPDAQETAAIVSFFTTQINRFRSHQLDTSAVAGPGSGNANDRAAWTATARALLNLDETITKE